MKVNQQLLQINRNFIICFIVSASFSAVVAQSLTEYENHLTTTITIITGYAVYFGIFSVLFYLDNIAGFNALDFYCTAVSTGNMIVTADLQPIYSTGQNLTTNVTLTTGTDVTAFTSMFYKMRVYNNHTATQNVTMNILITK